LNQGSLFNSYSASKGVVSIICGIFFNLGILRDENIKISMLVDEFKSTALSDVSLKDLLSMRSGISFDASYNRANDTDLWQSLTFKRFGWSCCASNQNSSDVFPSRRVIEKWSTLRSQPGSRYYYSSFDTYLLCYVLEQTLGSSLAEFCQNHLWNPLGAEANAKWLVDDSGLPVGGEGLFCSSRDYMKIAFLMINNGTANGKKIVTEDWVSKMLKPYSREYETGSRDSFGFNTWLFQNGTYAFLGARGQGIFFNKQKNVALVHTGVEPHRSTGFRSRMFELWSQISSAT
jgi:CubicO group peptidase (beta-lactamase class C family)